MFSPALVRALSQVAGSRAAVVSGSLLRYGDLQWQRHLPASQHVRVRVILQG